MAKHLKPINCVGRIVIWDEFDEGIDKYPFVFCESPDKQTFSVGGLAASISAKSTIFLSATVEPYYEKFCK
jgi:hypothetical protein